MLNKILLSFVISFFVFSSVYAGCFKASGQDIQFLSSASSNCSSDDPLVFYSNPDLNKERFSNFNSILFGNGNEGYSLHFNINRDDSNIDSEQTLFSFYENFSGGLPVAIAGIKTNGEFFYVHDNNSSSSNGMSIPVKDDANFSDPHVIVISYHEKKERLTINIDDKEEISFNVNPIDGSKISRMEIGENFSGTIGNFKTYSTVMSSKERRRTIKILSD